MRQDKALQFMKVAESFASMSKDTTKVGCVILDSETNGILSSGYNGFPRGVNENIVSRWKRPEKYSFVVHAEANAVCQSSNSSASLRNATCVVTMYPCAECTKLLVQAGVRRIVTKQPEEDLKKRWGESFRYSKLMLQETGVVVQYV